MNTKISNLAKVLAIQAVILLVASNVVGFAGSFIIGFIGKAKSDRDPSPSKEELEANNYFKQSRAYSSYSSFFQDLTGFQDYPYRSFIGWRLNKYSSSSININQEGIRKTPILTPIKSNENVWMIGGSTVWGYTAADNETIPAYFQKLTSTRVVNLGEQAYTSRQSLNLLLNELVTARLDESSPTLVIAYEGVNDSIFPCLTDASQPFVHSREGQIQSALTAIKQKSDSSRFNIIHGFYRAIFPGVARFRSELSTFRNEGGPTPSRVTNERCLSKEYAKEVAFNLVQNWEATYTLLDSMDIRYYAILQPSPYQDPSYKGDQQIDYKTFINLIYPYIQQYAKGKEWFIDGSNWFANYGKPAWVDSCCHTNPKANEFIAEQMINQLLIRQDF